MTPPSSFLTGQSHFRELAGIPVAGGRLAAGRLYRSGDLVELTDADLARLDALGVARVIDLRSGLEQRSRPDRLPSGARLTAIAFLEGSLTSRDMIAHFQNATRTEMKAMMLAVYRSLVRDYLGQWRRFFAALAASEGVTVFHCTAGKDRTGIGAALLLTALGAAPEAVLADYLASGEHLATLRAMMADKLAPHGVDLTAIAPVLDVDADYLAAAFAEIDAGWGGVDVYLDDVLGVDRARLAERFVV
ncbi:protein tyrosine/serine phosphatase [Crenobacter luteus]|uniref:tyrosine-protein phosphatase n=1 Tax=Crenobacter luteus TaxID=1452487 RepID=UPI00104FB009|nr:tyrosine-protein phosphatase [Crenobacter luteus]TCP11544.1 protein tyrosine/serine phosphatase [Crenobacter luteus]